MIDEAGVPVAHAVGGAHGGVDGARRDADVARLLEVVDASGGAEQQPPRVTGVGGARAGVEAERFEPPLHVALVVDPVAGDQVGLGAHRLRHAAEGLGAVGGDGARSR